jgi:hypothetical protein
MNALKPAPGDKATVQPDVFTATYPDGPQNAEAMFVIGSDLFIITRDRAGVLYRAAMTTSSARELRLAPVGELGLGQVTDADILAHSNRRPEGRSG